MAIVVDLSNGRDVLDHVQTYHDLALKAAGRRLVKLSLGRGVMTAGDPSADAREAYERTWSRGRSHLDVIYGSKTVDAAIETLGLSDFIR
jgi:hypothetical protein